MWVPWAVFVACLVLSPVVATAAEPTEAEMRGVYEKKAGGLTAQQQDLRQRCERREYRQGQGDPGLAMQCLGAMAGPKGVSVKSFRKIACEKAEGKPGYVCDYTMALDMATGPNVPPSLSRIASQPQQCTGRFVKSDAGWVLTTSDCR